MNKPRPPEHYEYESEKYRLKHFINLPELEKRKALHTINEYPHFLYKYVGSDTKIEHLQSLLIDSDFYLSSCRQFNDPFDTTAEIIKVRDIKLLRKKFDSIVKRREPFLNKVDRDKLVTKMMINNNQNPNFDYEIFEKNMQGAGLFCLTEDPRSILMWSHYASNHEGVVLQFKISNDPASMLYALKMHYSKEYPKWSISDNDNLIKDVLLRKSIDWQYEKEWRILRIGGKDTFQPFKPEVITGVIFGCRAKSAYKYQVLEILDKRSKKYRFNVKTYSACMHKSSYKLNIYKDI